MSNVTLILGDARLVRATVRDALQNVLRGWDVTWTTSNRGVVDGQVLGDSTIARASVFGDDGQYLGRFTNRFDAQSVLNQFGLYGSPYQATSTNNEYGTCGSPYSSLSARNPYASRPPLIVKNGQVLAYYSVNTIKTPRVSPAFALSCDFP